MTVQRGSRRLRYFFVFVFLDNLTILCMYIGSAIILRMQNITSARNHVNQTAKNKLNVLKGKQILIQVSQTPLSRISNQYLAGKMPPRTCTRRRS